MLPTIPRSRSARWLHGAYVVAFLIYLFAPLAVVVVFAFNDSNFPSPPWNGFTLGWFLADGPDRVGLLHDEPLLRSIGVSFRVAVAVTLLTVAVGTCNAFLFERHNFRFRGLLYMMMLWPLVIPGVILGISILAFSSAIANFAYDELGLNLLGLRPGLPLVVIGQFSFITTITTLVISARLRKFDRTLEEAALNLGAGRWTAVRTVTLPYLAPAMLGAAVVAFLMSFENFNTTLMVVGSEAPLTIQLYSMVREGSTPVVNAVSVALMG
ncbi:MAG TPA: ABC transporter permease, partial [Kiloniellales bacterium]|nr:ABC transporter permease [Kiloniellales bacterium]